MLSKISSHRREIPPNLLCIALLRGRTPLYVAAEENRPSVIKFLLDAVCGEMPGGRLFVVCF